MKNSFAAHPTWQVSTDLQVETELPGYTEYGLTCLHGEARFSESNSGPQYTSGQQAYFVWPAHVWKEYNVMQCKILSE